MDQLSRPNAARLNVEIAASLDKLADLLDIQGANRFRVRAYRNAARLIRDLGEEVGVKLARGDDLSELPGIGPDLARKIATLATKGVLPGLSQAERKTPAGLCELLALPGLGPRRVGLLHTKLKLRGLADLRRALAEGKVADLPGFGAKTVARLAEALRAHSAQRILWTYADAVAGRLLDHMDKAVGVKRIVMAGSHRRQCETVGDLDLLVASDAPTAVIARFVEFPEAARITAKGKTRAGLVMNDGVAVDLRVVPPVSFGAALVYLTGSKDHNIALRRLALERGLKINEYGVFRGRRRIAGRTEAEVYAALGLPEIPPELRENRGEIEAAPQRRLPSLVTVADLRGDLHVHTSDSDGAASLDEMAQAARAAGLSYIAVTDHSRSLRVAHGLDVRRLRGQMARIDKLNRQLAPFVVLKSAEVDIHPDGSLDLPDEVLADLDLVVIAVHSSFDLSVAEQTRRILRAVEHPRATVLAHPTGRMIGSRPAVAADFDAIFKRAAACGVALEINSQPERLDLSDSHCRAAHAAGVSFAISSDAHAPAQFAFLARGIAQARRGWLGAGTVINTLPLRGLRTWMTRPRTMRGRI